MERGPLVMVWSEGDENGLENVGGSVDGSAGDVFERENRGGKRQGRVVHEKDVGGLEGSKGGRGKGRGEARKKLPAGRERGERGRRGEGGSDSGRSVETQGKRCQSVGDVESSPQKKAGLEEEDKPWCAGWAF